MTNKHAIFFIALPGGGKSTLIEKRNYKKDRYTIISADIIKESHKDYNSLRPDLLHEWSVDEAEEQAYFYASNGMNFVFDGGGVNNSYSIRIINKVKELGYKIHLIYIKTPLMVCIDRNSKRDRKVPEQSIVEKSYKIEECFQNQLKLVDSHEVIEYFTNENIFFDMDGVIAEYQSLPWLDNYSMDYVNTNFFKNSKPVADIIKLLNRFIKSGKNIYILSASPNSICNQDKIDWLEKYIPQLKKENIYFVGNKEHKTIMLNNLVTKLKLKKNSIMFIDDDHKTIDKLLKLGINAIHPSKLLADYGN